MAVAASERRPVLLIWVPDLHCNCSFTSLFKAPLPFALLEVDIPPTELEKRAAGVRVYNYMRPEPGAIKDEGVEIDKRLHIYFKSGFLMNHTEGYWSIAYWYLQLLKPVDRVQRMLVTDRTMLGLHVRNVFDAPRDEASAKKTTGTSAIDGAQKEYGKEGTEQLLKWRQASHWSNFVDRMERELKNYAAHAAPTAPPLKFYLAADSEAAYEGLTKRFNSSLIVTRRECASTRCDFRDCESLVYSLVDMLNLAGTRLILGSGYSSYSEVAAWLGSHAPRAGDDVVPLRLEMAGRDFGQELLPTKQTRLINPMTRASERCPTWEDVMNTPRDARWVLWDAGGGTRTSTCSTGCILKHCYGGRRGPCCVQRLHANWPIDCTLLPYGCANSSNYELTGRYVVDHRAVPKVVPSDTCPTREDVLNTYKKERWVLWGDATCADGCRFGWCDSGKLAPCCVKRQTPTWPVDCVMMPSGCFDPNGTLTLKGVVVQDKRAEEELVRAEWAMVTDAVPSLVPSANCPSREDIMNTPSSVRWSLWDDPNCEGGCALARCNGGRAAPCCVKRMFANWNVHCKRLEFGCYRRFSNWWWRKMIVRDRRRNALYNMGPELVAAASALVLVSFCVLLWKQQNIASRARCVASLSAKLLLHVSRRLTPEMRRRLLSRPSDTTLFCIALLLGCVYVLAQSSAQHTLTATQEMVLPGSLPLPTEPPVTSLTVVPPTPVPCAIDEEEEPEQEDMDENESMRPTLGSVADEVFKAPRWFVEHEREKTGAGLLFFAYGAKKTLNHFLLEAERAARSFREHNPGIPIAVVTNNATVNKVVFDQHIVPRMDLLFPGDMDNGGQMRGDNLPRQWLTRLYYMAHTPFELTWALDSNVMSCTPGAAQIFLESAFLAKLWGYHIAHASQNVLGRGEADVMYPHNFNIIFQWSEVTSSLMREWFLQTMRHGVTSDDQKTLHMAEMRLAYRSGLNVGKIAPAFGGAFYNAYKHENSTTSLRPDRARITPVLQGRVNVIHGTDPALCDTFNTAAAGNRQVLLRTMGKLRDVRGLLKSVLRYDTLHSYTECAAILGPDARYCMLNETVVWASLENASRAWVDTEDARKPVLLNKYIMPVILEDYGSYAVSKRCGSMCSEYLSIDTLGRFSVKLVQNEVDFRRSTTCTAARVHQIQHLALHEPHCLYGDLLRSLVYTRRGCKKPTPGKRWMHWAFRCTHNAPDAVEFASVERYSDCAPTRYAQLNTLSALHVTCPGGFALTTLRLRSDGCDKDRMRFKYRCSSVIVGDYVPPGQNPLEQQHAKDAAAAAIAAERNRQTLAGGDTYGVPPVRPRFSSATTCSAGWSAMSLDILEQHPMQCPTTHAIQSFRVVPCDAHIPLSDGIRFEYSCVPVREESTPQAYRIPRVGRAKLRPAAKKGA